jgi:hypothetical protein
LVITGTEDVSVPVANSLIIAEKITGSACTDQGSWTWTNVSISRETQQGIANFSYNNNIQLNTPGRG